MGRIGLCVLCLLKFSGDVWFVDLFRSILPVVPTECDVLIVCRQQNDKEWKFKEQHAKMWESIAGAERYSHPRGFNIAGASAPAVPTPLPPSRFSELKIKFYTRIVGSHLREMAKCYSIISNYDKVMNAAARLIYGLRHSDHISDALISLHWLRAQERVRFKMAVLMYKATYGTAPSYLSQLVRVADLPGRRSLRFARTNRPLISASD